MREQAERTEARDSKCYANARAKGEQTFTLRAQDVSAPMVIAEWIKLNINTAPAEKLREALDDALRMREWPARKVAD